jgi:hypothetical protein
LRVVRPLLVSLLAALIVVAGCTGSPSRKTAPNEFVDDACADLAAWGDSVSRAFTDVQNLNQLGTSSDTVAQEQLLATLSVSLRDADRATAQLANGISARGAPNVASGDDIKKSILETLNTLRELLDETRKEVDSFKVSTATREQSDKLRADIDDLTTNVGELFTKLAPLNENNDLRAAFLGSAACQGLASIFSS